MDDIRSEKEKLRRTMKDARAHVKERRQQTALVEEKLFSSGLLKGRRYLLAFMSFGTEIDLASIRQRARREGLIVCLPKIFPGHEMEFYEADDESSLVRHPFGMPEPAGTGAAILPDERDLCLVPGLAFTKEGKRLGYGGGYYDRYLARFRDLTTAAPCFREQVIGQIPCQKTDRTIDLLILPDGIIDCRKE